MQRYALWLLILVNIAAVLTLDLIGQRAMATGFALAVPIAIFVLRPKGSMPTPRKSPRA